MPSSSESGYAEAHPTTAANEITHSSSVASVPGTASAKGNTTTYLNTISQQPRSTSISGVLTSSTASLEMSSYAGIANGLLADRALSVFIASILLAIV